MAKRRRPKHLIEKAIATALVIQFIITVLQSKSTPQVVSHSFFDILHNSHILSNVSRAAVAIENTSHVWKRKAQSLLHERQQQVLDRSSSDAVNEMRLSVHRVTNKTLLTETKIIPRRLIFTYKTNILETKLPNKTYANVLELIEVYKTAWHNNNDENTNNNVVEIWFLNDTECRTIIQQVEPKLVSAFEEEPRGDFRGDICRIAALTLKGGYYLDVDLKVVNRPLLVPDGVAFATVRSQGRELFFQAFLASVPNHPILTKSLEYLIRVYGETGDHQLVGPATLFQAYETVHDQLPIESLWILEEFQLDDGDYPDLPRQDGRGLYCDYVVHDANQKQVYFYSRFVGASTSCMARCENKEGDTGGGDCHYEHDHIGLGAVFDDSDDAVNDNEGDDEEQDDNQNGEEGAEDNDEENDGEENNQNEEEGAEDNDEEKDGEENNL